MTANPGISPNEAWYLAENMTASDAHSTSCGACGVHLGCQADDVIVRVVPHPRQECEAALLFSAGIPPPRFVLAWMRTVGGCAGIA
jgi:hypothetical protein